MKPIKGSSKIQMQKTPLMGVIPEFLTTPCPSVHLHLCTYFNSGMAGAITVIFYVVKVWTLRFGIKYSSTGYMPIWGVNNGTTFGLPNK